MHANSALSGFASCRTRQIRAKLFRRVHWLCCTVLHKHIMQWTVTFFKLLPHFHRLVGLYRFPSAAQITDHWDDYKDHIISRKYTLDVLGDTPMCRAIAIIRDRIQEELTLKDFTLPILLLLISDGNPTDGDPLPIIEELHKMGVLTLGCYLGNQDILNAKRLYGAERQQWTEGAKLMFRISSVLRNDSYITRAMFNYLEDAGWQPKEGVRLFAQINQTEALDSFLKILLSGFIQDRQV
jgi:hypothetical protein